MVGLQHGTYNRYDPATSVTSSIFRPYRGSSACTTIQYSAFHPIHGMAVNYNADDPPLACHINSIWTKGKELQADHSVVMVIHKYIIIIFQYLYCV